MCDGDILEKQGKAINLWVGAIRFEIAEEIRGDFDGCDGVHASKSYHDDDYDDDDHHHHHHHHHQPS
jgi:hypothetical protein